MSRVLDLIATVRNTFRIKLGTISASGLTAARTFTLPDQSGTLALEGGAGGITFTTVEVNLGIKARRSGKFTIAGVDLTVGKPVIIQKASGPYTGKGTREDEAEMDLISVTGIVADSTTIQCYWQSLGPVRGNIKFNYRVGT